MITRISSRAFQLRLVVVAFVVLLLLAAMFSVPRTQSAVFPGPRLVATDAPANLVVSATSNASISLSWSAPAASVTSYQVERSDNIFGTFVFVGSTGGTTFSDSTVTSLRAYLYRVRAVLTGGSQSYPSNIALGTAISFEFSQLQNQPIKARHLNDVRTAINAVRAVANLSPATWTHSPPDGLAIQASDVQELRDRLTEALTALDIPVDSYQDPILNTGANGTPIRAIHIEQLQTRSTRGVRNAPPSISISDVTVNEGNSGTTPAVFNVTLSSASTQTISVNYETANDTASSPSDYATASGTLTFAPGQTSQPLSIQVVGDTVFESNENFFLNLSSPVNATLADSQGVGTILNDEVGYFEIPVYFHVIQDTNGYGYVEESRLDAQISVLNDAFNGASVAKVQFFFRKAGVTRDVNHDWFGMQLGSPIETEAKRMLRQGGANALNFYTAGGGNPTADSPYPFGWAWFPNEYTSNPCRDGVVVPFTTLKRLAGENPTNPFNDGDLPVHEVGHWLGLYHTFHDPLHLSGPEQCESIDDQVDDTPAHLNKYIGECPEGPTYPPEARDTCPSAPGTDPIHNYMTNYSDDCKSEFTPGQFARMADQYTTYRQSSTPPQCPVASVAWVEPSDLTWGPSNTLTVAGYAFNGSGGVELWWRDVTDSPPFTGSPVYNQVEYQPIPNSTDHAWSNTIPSTNKWHLFEVFVKYSGYQSRHFLYDGSTAHYYELVARHSGKCADVEGESTASGARVIQFGCGGWANQQWQIIPVVGGGYNKIVARHSGKVLDVQWGSLDNGTPVWQWDDNGTAAQQWAIIDVGGGYYKIVARHSGKVLDVTGGSTADLTQIQQWDYFANPNQQWLLRPVP